MDVTIPAIVASEIALLGESLIGEPLTYIVTSLPSHGVLLDPAGGAIESVPYAVADGGAVVILDPDNDYQGDDTFTYLVNDGQDSDAATVTVMVGGPQPVYRFPLDEDPGWSTTGQWAFGVPTGGGSHAGDQAISSLPCRAGSIIVLLGPGAPEQEWVLRPDGTLERLDNRFSDESQFWSRAFSPDGDALVGGPGGVYAITPDGATSRISTGDLLAAGDEHWAIEECDDTLQCSYSVVSWDTGAVSDGMLESIDSFGFVDPATRISPDGRSIVYRADTDGTGRRRILDVASGTSIEAGRINQLVFPDSWAADSSGMFVADGELQFVDRATGAVTMLEGFERIRTVATGPFSQ